MKLEMLIIYIYIYIYIEDIISKDRCLMVMVNFIQRRCYEYKCKS